MKNTTMTTLACVLLAAVISMTVNAPTATAFCGFYVAKADADLWNEASQVAIVRDGERTVLTMANDYEGELDEFAIVVPVPVVLEREQINVGDRALMERLDAFTAPRLVEYHDPNPCQVARYDLGPARMSAPKVAMERNEAERAKALGVAIEATYTVGEYDILILSAKQSDGLEVWLRESGYKLPRGASKALQPYVRQGLKFFVAKVNLKEQAKTGYSYLRPLQMAYESPRFMLPIRLGMLNARGPQDLIVYVLTRKGRVETSNYRTVRIPSEVELPVFVKDEFKDFYRAMFERAWEREGKNVAFLEYFWNMGWCDPCAANPLTRDELRRIGVFWLDEGPATNNMPRRPPVSGGGAQQALVSRLHIRYDSAHFPEDLMFQETRDQQNFQGRYILRHPHTGDVDCDAGRAYVDGLRARHERDAETLAGLTGWSMSVIESKMPELPGAKPERWWRNLWK